MSAKNTLKTLLEGIKFKSETAAKWMPRKGSDAIALERFMKLSPKQYRKLLVENTKVIETAMCQKEWGSITYEHVPSVAMARYAKAFGKHDGERFTEYKSGDTKVNASAVYPYDIVKTLLHGDSVMANKQWLAQPNYMVNSNERILPMCDVSQSMDKMVGDNPNLTCMLVCISLGIYISERNEGNFKNAFMTFSERPELQLLSGSLSERYKQLSTASWGMNTNLEKAFITILDQAVMNKVPESEMPTTLLILSDMEFDSATNRRNTALDMIKENYIRAGYNIPKVVFWNLHSKSSSNFPVQVTDKGVSLVSGFSPAILKGILTCDDMSPVNMMNKTINDPRYDLITI